MCSKPINTPRRAYLLFRNRHKVYNIFYTTATFYSLWNRLLNRKLNMLTSRISKLTKTTKYTGGWLDFRYLFVLFICFIYFLNVFCHKYWTGKNVSYIMYDRQSCSGFHSSNFILVDESLQLKPPHWSLQDHQSQNKSSQIHERLHKIQWQFIA